MASTQRCRALKRANCVPNWSSFPSVSTSIATESAKIRKILLSYTPLVEPLSLDEAYLDVTGLGRYAWDIARELRARIYATTSLTCSAGIAPNKMLAKIASDWRKPDGQFAILPDEVEGFMSKLPVSKLWGVGPKSAEKFASLGIHTCKDLQQYSLAEIVRRFGRWGQELYYLCRGQDDRPVEPNRIRKSLSNECTYSENLTSLDACRTAIDALIIDLETELQQKASHRQVRKAFVKVKFCRLYTHDERMSELPPDPRDLSSAAQRGLHAQWQKCSSAGGGSALRGESERGFSEPDVVLIMRRLLISILALALLGSLGLNIFLFNRGYTYYCDLNLTRLDPLGSMASRTTPEATKGKSAVILYGDSRAREWAMSSGVSGYQFVDRGVGGQTSAQVLGRFEAEIVPLKPDILLLQVGINDLKTIPLFPEQRDVIIERCQANIQEIVTKSRQLGATVILTTIFPVGKVPLERQLFWSRDVSVSVRIVNAYIRSLEGPGIIVLECDELLADENGVLKDDYSRDTLHLSSAGYEALNRELMKTLASIAQ